MKLIMTYYKKMIITYKKLFVMSFVIMAAVTVSNLLIPCGMRFLVDSISQANSLGQKELLCLPHSQHFYYVWGLIPGWKLDGICC